MPKTWNKIPKTWNWCGISALRFGLYHASITFIQVVWGCGSRDEAETQVPPPSSPRKCTLQISGTIALIVWMLHNHLSQQVKQQAPCDNNKSESLLCLVSAPSFRVCLVNTLWVKLAISIQILIFKWLHCFQMSCFFSCRCLLLLLTWGSKFYELDDQSDKQRKLWGFPFYYINLQATYSFLSCVGFLSPLF